MKILVKGKYIFSLRMIHKRIDIGWRTQINELMIGMLLLLFLLSSRNIIK